MDERKRIWISRNNNFNLSQMCHLIYGGSCESKDSVNRYNFLSRCTKSFSSFVQLLSTTIVTRTLRLLTLVSLLFSRRISFLPRAASCLPRPGRQTLRRESLAKVCDSRVVNYDRPTRSSALSLGKGKVCLWHTNDESSPLQRYTLEYDNFSPRSRLVLSFVALRSHSLSHVRYMDALTEFSE